MASQVAGSIPALIVSKKKKRLTRMASDVKKMAAEMYAEIHVNLNDFQSRNQLEVPRMPGYHEIKEQILECHGSS
ncbi:hypothetical protein MKW92_052164 [Papaver armeniacum]|nr:hypothetical protein MKW92_052164 [Papaver armeniacum]